MNVWELYFATCAQQILPTHMLNHIHCDDIHLCSFKGCSDGCLITTTFQECLLLWLLTLVHRAVRSNDQSFNPLPDTTMEFLFPQSQRLFHISWSFDMNEKDFNDVEKWRWLYQCIKTNLLKEKLIPSTHQEYDFKDISAIVWLSAKNPQRFILLALSKARLYGKLATDHVPGLFSLHSRLINPHTSYQDPRIIKVTW